ncbi:MAG: 4-amino-4-deoxy-L-arabinose transferase [Patescibacteria group bacterium]|nr:4-amino-4-deoxy-L-arabinose transferase [Patescibacteria group bacterium]
MWSALAVVGGVALLLVATSPLLPITWDEGDSFRRAHQIFDGQWEFTTQREGHPAGYAVVIAAGWWLTQGWLSPLTAIRFGPMVLFAFAAGAMFHRLAKEHSFAAGLGGVAAILLLPRMFAHAHVAAGDGPLTACWLLAWATFTPAKNGWKGACVWGGMLGLTLSMKATGWLAPVPFILWVVLYRDRAAARALGIGLPIALGVFLLLNPPLWTQPMDGLTAFFQLNTGRAGMGLNLSTQFLGRMYNLDHPLPWHNTLLWTAVTVPLGLLVLAGIGSVAILRRPRDRSADVLILLNWLTLLVVRALPGIPVHDGVRLFLPSFAFLAALAGVGVHEACQWAVRRRLTDWRPRILVSTALGLISIACLTNLVVYSPQWLSYYNVLIGGLPGAAAAGMEPTYWWDSLDANSLAWLNAHTTEGEKIRFAAPSADSITLLSQWGLLRRGWHPAQPGRYRWYVLQHRPSAWLPCDRWLLENAVPAYRRTLLGVPLLSVYHYRDLEPCEPEALAPNH